jgi:hypothetical protein
MHAIGPPSLWRETLGGPAERLLTANDMYGLRLTSHGAVVSLGTFVDNIHVVEWRDGGVIDVTRSYPSTWRMNGSYASWVSKSESPPTLYRRDFDTGTTIPVSTDGFIDQNSIGPNGDVVWISFTHDVRLLHNGVTTDVTTDGAAANYYSPVTDGINIAATRGVVVATAHAVALVGGQEIDLGPKAGLPILNNGWMAFLNVVAPSTVAHVWTRAPDGTLRQVEQFSSIASIDALGADGTVVFTLGDRSHQYASAPPYTSTADLGQPSTVIERDGRLLYLIGGAAFVIVAPR